MVLVPLQHLGAQVPVTVTVLTASFSQTGRRGQLMMAKGHALPGAAPATVRVVHGAYAEVFVVMVVT